MGDSLYFLLFSSPLCPFVVLRLREMLVFQRSVFLSYPPSFTELQSCQSMAFAAPFLKSSQTRYYYAHHLDEMRGGVIS